MLYSTNFKRNSLHLLLALGLSTAIASEAPLALPQSRIYLVKDNVSGPGFYTYFNFETIEDPTHGRVTYVDQPTAIRENLTYATPDTFILRTEHHKILPSYGPGRKSVRIISKTAFKTHVAVFDVRHMPEGCGTWPAIWEVYPYNWPSGGEVDIVEGVNNQPVNAATLHTNGGCSMPSSSSWGSTRKQLGTDNQNNCDWRVNYNAGCGVSFPKDGPPSFGPAFNKAGGGWFVFERTPYAMRFWFWSRNDPAVPEEIKSPAAPLVDPSRYGTPYAYFPNTQCDFKKYFKENNIVINLTLCGDWAGESHVWRSAGCPAPSCKAFVESNPAALTNAFFDFANIRVYEVPFPRDIF